ncbi:DciA family protein [Dermabacter vaginalis]|uniref:DUF721 domain-containing protein n=1 Tax=Dermabacter vaginalis TaxID=1630135 RepID=UPI0021A6EBDE|nr:DciA family protein [Dermabacter vaginalis]MCT2150634.1 DciA family protein [Dermabacter vaginalis]
MSETSGGHGRQRPSLNPYALGTWQQGGGAEQGHGVPEQVTGQPRAEGGGEGSEATVGPRMTDELAPDTDAKPRDFSRPDELGRRALNQARAAAKKHGYRPRASRLTKPKGDPRGERAQGAGYSGARPDPRDPQRLNTVLEKMLVNLGWDRGLSAGRVLAEWDDIVGPAIAQHSHIESFEEGVLVVSTDSSAWAAQLRMLGPQIVTRIHERVGAQVVSEIKVAGPSTQSWKKGRRTVTWRGPRDTYG